MSVYISKVDIFTFLSQSAEIVISPNTVTTMLTPLSPDVHSVVEYSPNTNSSACLYVTGQHWSNSNYLYLWQDGYTALMFAASNGRTETVLALIAANADVHAKDNVSEVWVRSLQEGGCVCVYTVLVCSDPVCTLC